VPFHIRSHATLLNPCSLPTQSYSISTIQRPPLSQQIFTLLNLFHVSFLKPPNHIFQDSDFVFSWPAQKQPRWRWRRKHVYSVWALPPDDVAARLKKLMESLRSEFGGPHFEPHITVVGAISLTPDDALRRFRSACEGVKAYAASVDRVATGPSFISVFCSSSIQRLR
jgi:hypothetical protein